MRRLNFAAETSLSGLSVVTIALGAGHTCAIMSEGSVKCWGLNSYGQLGIGSTAWQGSVVNVPGTFSVIAVCVLGGMLMTCWLCIELELLKVEIAMHRVSLGITLPYYLIHLAT